MRMTASPPFLAGDFGDGGIIFAGTGEHFAERRFLAAAFFDEAQDFIFSIRVAVVPEVNIVHGAHGSSALYALDEPSEAMIFGWNFGEEQPHSRTVAANNARSVGVFIVSSNGSDALFMLCGVWRGSS